MHQDRRENPFPALDYVFVIEEELRKFRESNLSASIYLAQFIFSKPENIEKAKKSINDVYFLDIKQNPCFAATPRKTASESLRRFTEIVIISKDLIFVGLNNNNENAFFDIFENLVFSWKQDLLSELQLADSNLHPPSGEGIKATVVENLKDICNKSRVKTIPSSETQCSKGFNLDSAYDVLGLNRKSNPLLFFNGLRYCYCWLQLCQPNQTMDFKFIFDFFNEIKSLDKTSTLSGYIKLLVSLSLKMEAQSDFLFLPPAVALSYNELVCQSSQSKIPFEKIGEVFFNLYVHRDMRVKAEFSLNFQPCAEGEDFARIEEIKKFNDNSTLTSLLYVFIMREIQKPLDPTERSNAFLIESPHTLALLSSELKIPFFETESADISKIIKIPSLSNTLILVNFPCMKILITQPERSHPNQKPKPWAIKILVKMLGEGGLGTAYLSNLSISMDHANARALLKISKMERVCKIMLPDGSDKKQMAELESKHSKIVYSKTKQHFVTAQSCLTGFVMPRAPGEPLCNFNVSRIVVEFVSLIFKNTHLPPNYFTTFDRLYDSVVRRVGKNAFFKKREKELLFSALVRLFAKIHKKVPDCELINFMQQYFAAKEGACINNIIVLIEEAKRVIVELNDLKMPPCILNHINFYDFFATADLFKMHPDITEKIPIFILYAKTNLIKSVLLNTLLLHSKGIRHLDIKPENMICKVDMSSRDILVNPIDMGSANADYAFFKGEGTPFYRLSVSLFTEKGYCLTTVGTIRDIYATGITCLEILGLLQISETIRDIFPNLFTNNIVQETLKETFKTKFPTLSIIIPKRSDFFYPQEAEYWMVRYQQDVGIIKEDSHEAIITNQLLGIILPLINIEKLLAFKDAGVAAESLDRYRLKHSSDLLHSARESFFKGLL
jgi:serine/threonine protein kinase